MSPLSLLPWNRPRQAPEPGSRFLLLFALANVGGVIAYAPLLTLLLPTKIAMLAGDERIEWLAAATFFGAIAASLGNILFGWASDVWGSRARWLAAGLAFTIASYGLLGWASTKTELVAAIVVYQFSLNMLLGPLFAWAADVVPDSRKGLLGGLIAAGQPLGALAGVVATLPGFPAELRLASICVVMALLIAPLLLGCPAVRPVAAETIPVRSAQLRLDFALAWAARLLMQVAGNVLFAFLLFYFYSLKSAPSQSTVATLSAVALTVAFPIALLAGRISDRVGPRRPFLIAAAMLAAIGLALMSAAKDAPAAIVGYMLFSSAAAVFASLHTGFSMQLLPSAKRRGRDMGIFNLTNTLPALLAPVLTLALVPAHGFALLLEFLSGAAVLAGLLILLIGSDTQRIRRP